MPSGSPDTSTLTAPQKHSPLCIAITITSPVCLFRLRQIGSEYQPNHPTEARPTGRGDRGREKLKPLRGEIAALERELEAMREIKRDHGPAIANRKIDTKGCRTIPILCRRLARTALDLRPLFAQYHQEAKGNQ